MDIVYLTFNKGFDTVSHNILEDTLMNYRLDDWTVRQIEKQVHSQAQKAVITGTKYSCRLVTSAMEIHSTGERWSYWINSRKG